MTHRDQLPSQRRQPEKEGVAIVILAKLRLRVMFTLPESFMN